MYSLLILHCALPENITFFPIEQALLMALPGMFTILRLKGAQLDPKVRVAGPVSYGYAWQSYFVPHALRHQRSSASQPFHSICFHFRDIPLDINKAGNTAHGHQRDKNTLWGVIIKNCFVTWKSSVRLLW